MSPRNHNIMVNDWVDHQRFPSQPFQTIPNGQKNIAFKSLPSSGKRLNKELEKSPCIFHG